MKTMLSVTVPTLLTLVPWICAFPQDAKEPRQIRILAEIDGVDDLHLNATEARWVHREYQMPTSVSINARPWDPSQREHWVVEDSDPFLAPDVDLAGATVAVVRGRGEVRFRHGKDGLVLTFDDGFDHGAGEYEVLVEFADVLCEEKAVVGDVEERSLEFPSELFIEAHVDGRDELHLGPRRADWLHLAWSWPKNVRIGGRAWDPNAAPLDAPAGRGFFSRSLDLEEVQLEVEKARGEVTLEAAGGRLFVHFDDEAAFGADDYAVRLRFPERPKTAAPRRPTGVAHRVEVVHRPAKDVVGAALTVLALSPATGRWDPWPGRRGMDAGGRCVVALPAGTYRFEVLQRPAPDRLVALRTAPISVNGAKRVRLASKPVRVSWRHGEIALELQQLAIASILGEGEVAWSRKESASDLRLVVSPGEQFSLRAIGSAKNEHVAWWTVAMFDPRMTLDSSKARWTECLFTGAGGGPLPEGCEGTLHGPRSEYSFPIDAKTRLLTNRRFVGFSYRHEIEGGGSVAFRQRPVTLPEVGRSFTFELGGELKPVGSAAILLNENLGSPDAQQLWWELQLVDPSGHVLDAKASDIEWAARAAMRDGSPLPGAPLDEEGKGRLADPIETVVFGANYRWNGVRGLRVHPAAHVVFENEQYRSKVPGHLRHRARAYLDKARRTYRAIEEARGKPGDHTDPIELKWWLNGGAVGVWGSITMPIAGMTNDYDWFSFPWALAHESLHAFGYHHGPELDRLDREAMRIFERMAWQAEFDPEFVFER